MSEINTSAPGPIDIHVGRLLRAYRQFAGLTLGELGAAVGVSHQQFQKYERATNRISAAKLVETARALRIPPEAFFEGLDVGERQSIFDHFTPFFAEPYSTRLASAFMHMNPHQQRALTELAETIAPTDLLPKNWTGLS